MAAACNARLVVVTVEDRHVGHDKGIPQLADIEGIGEAAEFIAATVLHRAKENAERQGVGSIETQRCWGDPATAITDAADGLNPDVIVVGRRGRSRLVGLLLGSVSQALVIRSPRAVMVVP